MVPHEFVTTGFELPGYRIKRNFGIVRGIVVRSRSIVGTIGASLQTIVGGNISLFSNLCEQTRQIVVLSVSLTPEASATIDRDGGSFGHPFKHEYAAREVMLHLTGELTRNF